jgi:hypothetical protein
MKITTILKNLLQLNKSVDRKCKESLLLKVSVLENKYQDNIEKEMKAVLHLKNNLKKEKAALINEFIKSHQREVGNISLLMPSHEYDPRLANNPGSADNPDIENVPGNGMPLNPRILKGIKEEIDRYYFRAANKIPITPSPRTSPEIVYCPNTIEAGIIMSITGVRFGREKGRIYISNRHRKVSPPLIDSINVLYWTDTAIEFWIDTSGIGFDAILNLYVERPDEEYGEYDGVKIIPIYYHYKAVSRYSDSGSYTIHGVPDIYRQYIKHTTVYSPVLPENYRIFYELFPKMGTSMHITTRTIMTNLGRDYDYAERAEYSGDPYITYNPNRIAVNVKISNGWYWDYELRVEFHILIPKGFQIPNGWILAS